jgi:hypothetical protein
MSSGFTIGAKREGNMLDPTASVWTIADVYQRFARMYADSTPIRGPRELDAAVRAAGIEYEDVTQEWLRELNYAWVYGDMGVPFTSDALNRKYMRMLHV